MKLPDPTPEELMQRFMQSVPTIHKTSTDTGIGTLGAVACTIIAGVIWADLSSWWLLLATPLTVISWLSEVKNWRGS